MRVVVLADTHIAAARAGARTSARRLPPDVYAALRRADAILHAGDVVTRELLEELASYAPVHAVLGNNDQSLVGDLPETLELDLGGVPVAMVHDSGARAGRPKRMMRRFPDAAIVVYGHSHLPEDSEGDGGQRLFNPGSPTERRHAPERTYGMLDLVAGRIRRHQILPVTA